MIKNDAGQWNLVQKYISEQFLFTSSWRLDLLLFTSDWRLCMVEMIILTLIIITQYWCLMYIGLCSNV